MTATEIVAQIDKLNNEIGAAEIEKNAANTNYTQWKVQHDALTCNQTLKKNREKCQADKAWKYERYNYWLNERNRIQGVIDNKQAAINSLENEMSSQQTASINLSTQGLTSDAVITRANADALATVRKAEVEAQAKLEDSRVETEGKKNLMYLGIAFGAVVLIVISIVVYRKYIKRKKSTK